MRYHEEYEYFKKELLERDKQGNYFHMANEELAKEYYKEGIKEFPNLRMYKFGIEQFFCISGRARRRARQTIEDKISKRKIEITELCLVLERIRADEVKIEKQEDSNWAEKEIPKESIGRNTRTRK